MGKRIVYMNSDGGISIIIPNEEILKEISIEELAIKDTPAGVSFSIVDELDIPTDRLFRDAWEITNEQISANVLKSKNIAHILRREMRDVEFAPLDIESTIPSKAQQAEAKRESVRLKYELMQGKIDSSATIEDIKKALGKV